MLKLYVVYGDEFGERFIGNLINHSTFCDACGILCEHCRTVYPSFAEDFEGIFEVEKDLPTLIDEPEKYLPKNLGLSDVLVVIGVHADLLLALPKLVMDSRVKAVIIPIENKDWCTPAVKKQLMDEFNQINVEVVFPKPFCSLEKLGNEGIIDKFIDRYMVGRPKLEVKIIKGVIRKANVLRSAPCGSTWYVAQQIKGHKVEGIEEVISKAHHSYPCTASMEVDKELGDTILHKAGYIIREEVLEAIKKFKLTIKA
ncbi:thymidylate synthase [Candidatus Bathyarchaeota archaeon]|nr:MAG: thymidylate synthase [Candidatus Bathyarchaeota archaeon]